MTDAADQGRTCYISGVGSHWNHAASGVQEYQYFPSISRT